MEPSEKVIEKIESGAFSNLPQLKYADSKKSGKSKKSEKSTKNGLTEEGKQEIKAIVQESNKAINNGTAKPDAPEAKAPEPKAPEPKAPEPKAPKSDVAAFPIKAHLNIYGFLGFSKSELRALGLTIVTTPKAKNKLSADVLIELTSYDVTAKILTIKIL